ncbi:MAG: FRG domain-containing protein [Chthoniobacterales bacterium]
MEAPESSKIAKSLGKVVELALAPRNRWSKQHADEAKRDKVLREQWDEIKPFWTPWFRGHEEVGWQLKTTLYRGNDLEVDRLFTFEEELRGEFKRRGSQLAAELSLPAYDDEWGWYGLMRHYGAPTRLLDWSDGVLTALYFAVRDTQKEDRAKQREDKAKKGSKTAPGACVWMLDPYRLDVLSFCPKDDALGVALPDWEPAEKYLPEIFAGRKLRRAKPSAVDPPHVFRRLSSQRSHFTVFGTHPDGLEELRRKSGYLLEKITIPADAVPAIRIELELSGISEATILPDLEALSRELEAVWKVYFGARLPRVRLQANQSKSK